MRFSSRKPMLLVFLALTGTLPQAQKTAFESLPTRVLSFEKVVDTQTSIPGMNLPYTGFRSAALDGPRVAFHGENFLGPQGIYVADSNGLSTIVDSLTPIPGFGPKDTFVGVSDPSIDQGRISFTGARDVPGLSFEGCLSADLNGNLTVVAARGDAVPDAPGFVYLFFFTCSASEGNTGFASIVVDGSGNTRWGIYADDGGLHTVADTTTPQPGAAGTFTDFHFNGTFSQGASAFCGGGMFNPGQPDGIYTDLGGLLQVVADLQTAIPGGSGNFTTFLDSPVIHGRSIVFRAGGSAGQKGVYTNALGLSRVADTSTSIPLGSGSFTGFNDFSYHGPAVNQSGAVAFVGDGSSSQQGIYSNLDGPLFRVVERGQSFDGKIISHLDLGRQAFDRRRIAFTAYFSDGSAGVYVARVP